MAWRREALRGRSAVVAGRRRTALLLAACALLAAACGDAPAPSPDTVALIGSEEVRYERFEAYLLRNLGEPGTALSSEVLSRLFDQFVDELLLRRLAADRGLVASGADARRAVTALLEGAGVEPGEDEVAAYYEAHHEEFSRPERVVLRQILVEDEAMAREAAAQLAAGADFAEVARRLSQEAGAELGGDQGELARDELPAAFADIIFALEPGEVSDIVPAEYGFHLFQVIERLPARQLPLDEAASSIRETLRHRRAERLQAELVEEARNLYNPKVYERNLPFNYRGTYLTPPSG